MNKVKREKAYIIGRIREQVTLTKREKVLCLIKVLEIILEIYPRIIIKEQVLKIKKQQNTISPKGRETPNNYVKNNEHKEPIKCLECQGPHYAKYCLNMKGNFKNMHTIQVEEIVGYVANEIPRINIALEN